MCAGFVCGIRAGRFPHLSIVQERATATEFRESVTVSIRGCRTMALGARFYAARSPMCGIRAGFR